MKKSRWIKALAMGLAGGVLVIGCGGGGGDSDESVSTTLDTTSLETLSKNIAEMVPGCEYVGTTTYAVTDNRALLIYRDLADKAKITSREVATRESTEETNELNGTCGGKVLITQTDEEQAGDYNLTDYTVDLIDYCYCETDRCSESNTTLSGSFYMQVKERMTVAGEDFISLTASTGENGVQSTVLLGTGSGVEKSSATLYIKNFIYTEGENDIPSSIVFDEVRIDYGAKEYKITNAEMDINQSDTGYIQIKHAYYYDPDVGMVEASTNKIPLSPDSNESAEITLQSNGKTATLISSGQNPGKFFVEQDGEEVGALDCSVAISSVE